MRRAAWTVGCLLAAAAGAFGQPPVGETVRIRQAGRADRVVKVLRREQTTEGLTRLVVKDGKTGEVFTLTDMPATGRMASRTDAPPAPAVPESPSRPAPTYSGLLTAPAFVPTPAAPAPTTPPPAAPTPVAVPTIPVPIALPDLPLIPIPPIPSEAEATPTVPTIPVQPVSMAPVTPLRPYVQSSMPAPAPPVGFEPPDVRMQREIAPWVAELTTAARPSIRMDAATALAEGRYGWRDEVKAHLAKAAATDPAAIVRAHCISLLSTLGYAEAEYRTSLAVWAGDKSPDVRVAASVALAKLEPR
jgi:hypothetical protein